MWRHRLRRFDKRQSDSKPPEELVCLIWLPVRFLETEQQNNKEKDTQIAETERQVGRGRVTGVTGIQDIFLECQWLRVSFSNDV